MVNKKTEELKPIRIIGKFIGLVFPLLYLFLAKNVILWILFTFVAVIGMLDFFRLKSKGFNVWLFNYLGFLLKEKEKNKISSILWLFIGSFITVLFFDKAIAVISLFIFTAGDSAGAIFGKRFHKFKMFKKSLEGNIACFILAFLFGFSISLVFGFPALKVIMGALAATIIQAFPLKIDDNLTMPVIAGIVMSLV